MPDYLELRARVEATSPGLYRVFLSGPAGDASGVLQLPFADYEVENFVGSQPVTGVPITGPQIVASGAAKIIVPRRQLS